MAILGRYLCWGLLVSVLSVRVRASPRPQVDVGDHMEMDERDADLGTGVEEHHDFDLRLTQRQYWMMHGNHSGRLHDGGKRKQVVNLWPEATMYYKINAKEFSKKQMFFIESSFTEIERYTCVKFRPKTAANKNYVDYVHGNSGCSSDLGLLDKGRQDIHLNKHFCRRRGKYIHETLHSLGIIHQHQRWDRDKYVTVNWDNMLDGSKIQFNKYRKGTYPHVDSPYGFRSIMHYSQDALSASDEPTLTPKDTTPGAGKYMGQRTGLSYIDVLWLNKMYKCADKCSQKDKCGQNGHLDQSCNCICEDGTQSCDSTKTTVSDNLPSCHNTHDYEWQCYRWAANGECMKRDEWMKANCAKACGECGHNTGKGLCSDRYHDCQPEVNLGRCINNKPWMRIMCAKSCGHCRAGECFDNFNRCESLLEQCETQWMQNNCSKSCGSCGNGQLNAAIACEDKHKECRSFKERGACITSPIWMQDNCPKACNYCQGRDAPRPEIDCTDKESMKDKCFHLAMVGHCVIRPEVMAEKCPRTCQLCNKKP